MKGIAMDMPLMHRLAHTADTLRRLGYQDMQAAVLEAMQELGTQPIIIADTLSDRLARRAAHAEQLGFRGAAKDIREAIAERRRFTSRNMQETEARISELLDANSAEVARRRTAEALMEAGGHFIGLDNTGGH